MADGFDLGQAAANMQLAAWELGIGSCIASMHEPEKAKAILGVPQELHFDVALSFGYPLHSHEQPQAAKPGGRKPFDEVVFWERWANTASVEKSVCESNPLQEPNLLNDCILVMICRPTTVI